MTALVLCWTAAPLHAAEEEARVLILNGVDPYLPAYLAIDGAMRESLAKEPQRRIVFFSEPLDAQRFPAEALESEFLALLTKKYSATHIDVVVAISLTALEFFKRHGEQIWPGSRVVYQGFPGEDIGPAALPPNATGVLAHNDVDGTIDLARRLQPGAHRVVVVSGASALDKRVEQLARTALSTRAELAPVEFLSGLPLPELVARVAAEPVDAIVFYLAQFRDRDGRPYTPREVLRAISKESVAPVYGFAETYIGFGAAAGNVESYEAKGRLVGEQVRAALGGGPPDPSRVLLETPSRCVADARALRRWSLDERRLPSGCEIRFADRPFWRQYWWQIAVALAIVVGQTLLIASLIAQRRRGRLAEQVEQAQRAELAHASRLALAGVLTGAIAHEINQPLGAILSNADAADLILESGTDRRDELRRILADIRRDDERASEVIHRLRALLGKGEFERTPVELNEVVSELEPILRTEAKRRGVTLEIRPAPMTITIVGDRIQIQQVLINLVLNAMDAVDDEPEVRRRVVVSIARGREWRRHLGA